MVDPTVVSCLAQSYCSFTVGQTPMLVARLMAGLAKEQWRKRQQRLDATKSRVLVVQRVPYSTEKNWKLELTTY